MSPPWMPLYIADYLADTRRLSAAEHGAYLLLIMEYWQVGSIPADDRQLARIACMTDREWKSARPLIATFFQDGWKHARIDAELAEARVKYERRAAAGQKGGIAKASTSKQSSSVTSNASGNATSGPEANDKQCSTNHNHTILTDRTEDKSSGDKSPAEPTDPVDRLWKIGVDHLEALGLPPAKAKPNIGKWMRDTGNDAGRVLAAIARAREHSTGDPIALIGRILNPISHGTRHGNGHRNNQPAPADRRIASMARVSGAGNDQRFPTEDTGWERPHGAPTSRGFSDGRQAVSLFGPR